MASEQDKIRTRRRGLGREPQQQQQRRGDPARMSGGGRPRARTTAATSMMMMTEEESPFDCSPNRSSIARRRARVPPSAGESSGRLRAARRLNQPFDDDEAAAAPPPTPNRRPSPRTNPLARKRPWLDDRSIASTASESSALSTDQTPADAATPRQQQGRANQSSPRTSPSGSPNSTDSGGSPREAAKERRRKSRPWRVDVLLKKGGGRAVEHSTTSWKQQMKERKEVFALSGVTVVEQELDYAEDEPERFPDLDNEGGDHDDPPPQGPRHAEFYSEETSRELLDDDHDDSVSTGAVIQLANPLSSHSSGSSDGTFSDVMSPGCPKTINIEKYTRPLSPTTPAGVTENYDNYDADEISDGASSSVAIHNLAMDLYDPDGTKRGEEEDGLTNMAVTGLGLARQETVASTTSSERRAIDTFRSLSPPRPNDPTSPTHSAVSESGTAASEETPVIHDAMAVVRKSLVISDLKRAMDKVADGEHALETVGQASSTGVAATSSTESADQTATAEVEEPAAIPSATADDAGPEKASSSPNAAASASQDGSFSESIVSGTTEDEGAGGNDQEEEDEEDELKATKSRVIQEMESSVPLSLKKEARYSLVSIGRASRVLGEKKVEAGYAEALLRKSLFLKELGVTVADLYTSDHVVVESTAGVEVDADGPGHGDETGELEANGASKQEEPAQEDPATKEPNAANQVLDSGVPVTRVPSMQPVQQQQESLSTSVVEPASGEIDTKGSKDADAVRRPSGKEQPVDSGNDGGASNTEAIQETLPQSPEPAKEPTVVESTNNDATGNVGENQSPADEPQAEKKGKGKANKWKQRLAKKKGGEEKISSPSISKTAKDVSTPDTTGGVAASPTINIDALDDSGSDVNAKGRKMSTKGQKWMKRLASKRGSKAGEDSPKAQNRPIIDSPVISENPEAQNADERITTIPPIPKLKTSTIAKDGPTSHSIIDKAGKAPEHEKIADPPLSSAPPSSGLSNPDNSKQCDQTVEESTPAPKAQSLHRQGSVKDGSTIIASSSDPIKVPAAIQTPVSRAIEKPSDTRLSPTKASPRDLRNSFMAFDALLQQRQGFTLDSNTIGDDYTEYTIEDTITNDDPKDSASPEQQAATGECYDTETQYEEYSIGQSYMEYTVEETVQESEFGSGLEPPQAQVNNAPQRSASVGYNTGLMSSRMFTSPQVVAEPTITVNQVEDDEMTQLTFDHSYSEPIPQTPPPPPANQKIEKPLKFTEKKGTPTTSAGSSTSSRRGTSVAGSQRSASSRSSTGSEGNSKRISELLRTDVWSDDYTVVQEAIEYLLSEASRGTRQRVKINKFGGVMGIVRAMEKHREIDAIQVAACGALEKMALDPDTQVVIGEMGGISAIVQAMKSRPVHEDIQQAGSAALANISRHRGSKDEGDGAVPALCGCMSRFPSNMIVQAKAFAAIANLCMDNTIRLKELSDCGGMLAMTLALQKPWPSKTEKHAAISNLSILLRCLAEQEEGGQTDDESGYFDQEDGCESIDVMSLMSGLDDATAQLEQEGYPYEIQDRPEDLSTADEYQHNREAVVYQSHSDAEGDFPPSHRVEISRPGFENLGDALQPGVRAAESFGDGLQSGVRTAESFGDGLQPSVGDVDFTGEPGLTAKQPSTLGDGDEENCTIS